jgi:hypothetical protein
MEKRTLKFSFTIQNRPTDIKRTRHHPSMAFGEGAVSVLSSLGVKPDDLIANFSRRR